VAKNLIGRRLISGLKLPGRLQGIVDGLFPQCQPPIYPTVTTRVEDLSPFSLKELAKAGSSLPREKAPGPDDVPDEVGSV